MASYASLLESGMLPDVAHTVAFTAERRTAAAEPSHHDCRYARLLERGITPVEAFALVHAGVATGIKGPEGTKGPEDEVCSTCIPPIAAWTVTSPTLGDITVTPAKFETVSDSRVTSTYLSIVYRLAFTAVSAPNAGLACTTWLRINLPCWGDLKNTIPVVIGVEGSIFASYGVNYLPSMDSLYTQMVYLTTGETPAKTDFSPNLYIRSGEDLQMITATFSQPGRGDAAAGWVATANPLFTTKQTPDNKEGQDYCGPLAVDFMTAATDVVADIVDQFRADSECDLYDLNPKWVVLSSSNGLTLASRWIKSTTRAIAALVDYEEPTDGEEQTQWIWKTNALGLGAAEAVAYRRLDESWTGIEIFALPTTLTWSDWSAWFEAEPETFWFRPPVAALSGYVPAPGPILAGAAALYPVEWEAFYLTGGRTLKRDTSQFWSEREAGGALPWLLPRECAYVRIQSWDDHSSYPTYLRCQKATKALRAVYAVGGKTHHPHCYYTSNSTYYVGHTTGMDSSVAPTSWTILAGSETSPCTDWPSTLTMGDAWGMQVDLVRWAMSAVFAY